jgi:hypothetical protein
MVRAMGERARPWVSSVRGLLACVVALAAPAAARVTAQSPPSASPTFQMLASCSRVADPKLSGGKCELAVELRPASGFATVTATLLQHGASLGVIWRERVACTPGPIVRAWDGRLATPPSTLRQWVDTGAYEVRFDAEYETTRATATSTQPLQVVRLGIAEIAALPNGPSTEWQMVYFKRGTQAGTVFYATPVLREYLSVGDSGDRGDLDRNDGAPRPSPAIHTNTASPAMEGTAYEDDQHNYPMCYLAGTAPCFEVRLGTTGVSVRSGLAMGAKHPIPGVLLRMRAQSSLGPWTSNHLAIAPGLPLVFQGPPLPNDLGRTDVTMAWSFECSPDGGASWQAIAGAVTTKHRIYTVLGIPRFGSSSGPQHNGPWVEVAEFAHTWKQGLGLPAGTPAAAAEMLVKGFGGQVGQLTAAIEGVRYDCGPLGGDGGMSHYYGGSHAVQLGRLLDNHANGVFVNCSDCASALAGMMGMLGLQNVQMQRLGNMSLRAIRGIGAPTYTLNLWGGGSHGFSYHHVVTRTAGTTVCDACLWVDEDGNPNALPGTPGFNHDRPFNGSATSYAPLLAWAPISFTLETLPILQ